MSTYLEGEKSLINEGKELSIADLLRQLFEKSRCDQICARLGQQVLTIEMLKEKCLKLSSILSKESCVGICMDLSIEFVILMCSLMLCGVPYVPLEPKLPSQRLLYIINDSKPSLILTDQPNENLLENLSIRVLTLNQLISINQNETKINRSISNEDIFCIMYTSGSTGLPKGVRLPYRALINRLYWQWRIFPYDQNDVCCLKTSISFVDSIAEIFAPLLKSIPLIILPKRLLLDINQLIDQLNEYLVTRIILVPSLLNVIIQYLSNQKKKLNHLRFIISSGENLPVHLIESFFNVYPSNCQLINLYGSTEVMADVTYEIFSSKEDLKTKTIDGRTSIGMPIDNIRIDFIDQDQYGIGELLVSGQGVANGYHNTQIATDKFIPDPNNQQKLAFRTGDVGRIWNQRIILFGRRDNQVKISGNRVNLNEIELILKTNLNFVNPISLLINNQIIVFYEKSEKLNSIERNSLLNCLPTYAIPSAFIKVEHFPLLVSGKIDRNQLLEMYNDQICKNVEKKEEMTNDSSGEFVKILEEFGIEKSNIDRDFFSAGGTSLNALLILSKLHQAGFNQITVDRLINARSLLEIQLDLFESKSESIEYFNNYIDQQFNYSFLPIEQVDKQRAFDILTQSFVNHGEIDTLIHQNHPKLKQQFIDEWTFIMETYWNNYLASNISFGVLDQFNQLIGLSLSYNIDQLIDLQSLSNHIQLLKPLNTIIDIPLQFRIEQLKTSEHLTRIMRNHVTTVDPNLTPGQRLQTTYLIEKHLLDIAKQKQYQAVITANTSTLTQQIAKHVLNYDTHLTIQVSQFIDPSNNTILFPDAPTHYTITISVKYIN